MIKNKVIGRNISLALCLIAPVVSTAGTMGVAVTPDSRIRVSDILFDENTVNVRASGQSTLINANFIGGTGVIDTTAKTFNGGANNQNSMAVLMDGLALDYEKDLNRLNFNVFNAAFVPMIGIRILGKNSTTYSVNATYPAVTLPELGGNLALNQMTLSQSDTLTVHPWSMMGAIYLGANTNLTDKLSVSGRVGPLLSGYDMQYRRTSIIDDTPNNIPGETFDTFTRRISKWGYGGFASLAAGYQITEHFALTGELMYSGFTSGAVNQTYYNVTNAQISSSSLAANTKSQTGSLKPSYISDAMGMIGAQFRF